MTKNINEQIAKEIEKLQLDAFNRIHIDEDTYDKIWIKINRYIDKSFKAGVEAGRKEIEGFAYTDGLGDGFEKGEKEGRLSAMKEIIKFLKKNGGILAGTDYIINGIKKQIGEIEHG